MPNSSHSCWVNSILPPFNVSSSLEFFTLQPTIGRDHPVMDIVPNKAPSRPLTKGRATHRRCWSPTWLLVARPSSPPTSTPSSAKIPRRSASESLRGWIRFMMTRTNSPTHGSSSCTRSGSARARLHKSRFVPCTPVGEAGRQDRPRPPESCECTSVCSLFFRSGPGL